MAEKTINARIQCKIDTAENWKTNNPVLLVGELGVESDTKLIKVGDGTTSWTSLPYLQYLPLSGGQLTGALKISKGSNSGIQDYLGLNLFYTDNNDVLHIRNDQGSEIHLGSRMGSELIQIGGDTMFSDINVIGRSFTFNDKSVAVTSDIPKTLNDKALVANGNTTIYGTDIKLSSDNTSNVTDAINGKADTSAIPTALYQLNEDTTHRVVTDTEKATWNAKSNFDGNYNSLTNKPTIPTNSDFTLAGLKEKSYNSLTDKPDISGKANLSGGNIFSGTQRFDNNIAVSAILTNGAGNTMFIGTGNAGLKYYNINNTSNMWNVVVDSNGNLIFQKG